MHRKRHAQRRLEFQRLLLDCVTEEDLREIADKLIEKAKTGDMYASLLLLKKDDLVLNLQ